MSYELLKEADSKLVQSTEKLPENANDKTAQAQIFGFNPLEILDSIEFPNDRYDEIIRLDKAARLASISLIQLESNSLPSHFRECWWLLHGR